MQEYSFYKKKFESTKVDLGACYGEKIEGKVMKKNDVATDYQTFFSKIVDEFVKMSEYDTEIADGVKWVDDKARRKGITFHDMMFEILYKSHIGASAKEWLKNKK